MSLFARLCLITTLLATPAWAQDTPPVVEVYKSPSCGCCEKWVTHMQANGFRVVSHNTDDLNRHKKRLGVPPTLGSCHTATVGGYLVEGHVPASDIKRLLKEKPNAKGLVSPGMPASAPGMDHPANIPYEILLVNKDGSTTSYARH